MKICADGGGNQLYEAFEGTDKQHMYIPHYIRGDLDSLRDDVRDFYSSKVEQDPDQNSTDFMKCIELVRRKESSVKHEIVALGTFGGRVDQAMSNIHYLYKLKNERRIYLLSDQNMTILLDKGKHQIHCNQAIEGPSCGIIPIGIERAIVTTTGLEWNLSMLIFVTPIPFFSINFVESDSTFVIANSSTSFGEMISTSNHLINDIVMIETDSPILWTVELKI
ncbi:2712_t:CDS:2 [Cetraspora pellucida]|uniref:2712_t:CDS:1 n=1 Tax=Cetraspora pellucida TaxID=1433469 RepID=A0ACA9NU80_9GLOM|nr:2712_t:CDS:2 [Cetraspora pellucida]